MSHCMCSSLESRQTRGSTTPCRDSPRSKKTYLEVLIALPVAGHDVVALSLEALGKVGCDEATSTSHTDTKLLGPVCLESKLCEGADLLQSDIGVPG